MRHATASRLVLPILCSCLVLAACGGTSSKAASTSSLLPDESAVRSAAAPACESIGGPFTVKGGACVAGYVTGYKTQADAIRQTGQRTSATEQGKILSAIVDNAGDEYGPAAYGFTAGMDAAAAHAGLAS